MKSIFFVFIITSKLLFSSIDVKIGGYLFPPYVEMNGNEISGHTINLINKMNSIQDKYNFVFVLTSPKRRYIDFNNKYDIIFFEDATWEWNEKKINFRKIDLKVEDYEIFFTLKKKASNEEYFKSYPQRKLVLIRGFHYPIVDFNTDESKIKSQLNIVFMDNPQKLVDFILSERADIGITTISSLRILSYTNIDDYNSLFLSESRLNNYNLSAIISNLSPISYKELEEIINSVEKTGFFNKI
jgi:hypothetical protein